MKNFSLLFVYVSIISCITLYCFEPIKTIDWNKERPEIPTGSDAQKKRQEKALRDKRNALKTKLEKDEKNGLDQNDPKIKLQRTILDYYDATLEQYDAEKRLKTNPDDKIAQESKRIKQEERDELNTKITQQIESHFTSASDNGQKNQKPAEAQSRLEKITSTIKNLIANLVNFSFPNKANIEKATTSLKKSVADQNISGLQPDFQIKPVVEKIELLLQAYDNPDNSNIHSRVKKEIEDYINVLENSDLEFSIQNKDPNAIAKHHGAIYKKLYDMGINEEQLKKFTELHDASVKKIKESFRDLQASENVKKFFTQTQPNSFNRTSFEEKFEQLKPRKFFGDELNEFKKKLDDITTMLAQLDSYARYSLDLINTEYRSRLLEFLQKNYAELALLLDRALTYNRRTEGIEAVISDATIEDIRAKAKQAETWLIDYAASTEKRKPSATAIKKIEEENKNAKPLDQEAITIARSTAPTYVDEFKAQLSKTNDPLDRTLENNVKKISESLAAFIDLSKQADPSKIGVDAAQSLLNSIKNLKDWIDLYATTFPLSDTQLRKLATYYSSLNSDFVKISQQRNNDIQNIFRRLDDGSLIILEKSRRKLSGEVYVPLVFNIQEIKSLDDIIEQLRAERKAMTTALESGGL